MTTNIKLLNSTKVFLKKAIKPWKDKIIKAQNGRCLLSQQHRGVDVHHVNKPFHEIVEETFEITGLEYHPSVTGYTQDELVLLSSTILRLHEEGVIGVLVARRLHILYHQQFKDDCTMQNWKEFKTQFKPRRKRAA